MAHPHNDPTKLPVAWNDKGPRDIEHHQREWTSGERGGGAVPKTFRWPTNPKQTQEEFGAGGTQVPSSPAKP